MKRILVISLLLVYSVYSDEKFTEDRKHFLAFLKEVSGTDYQMDSFIDLIWPQIQLMIPDTVVLSHFEILDPTSDFYMCFTPATIHPKLGGILDKKRRIRTREKTTYEIEANLLLDKPVELSLAKPVDISHASDANPSPLVHVSYLFKEPCKIKLILEIRNVLYSRQVLPPSCIMRIKSLRVEDVSNPDTVSKLEDASSKRAEHFFRSVFKNSGGSKMMVTFGLVKAVNDNLNTNPNFWVCSSRAFDYMAKVLQKRDVTTENYSKFCLQGKKE